MKGVIMDLTKYHEINRRKNLPSTLKSILCQYNRGREDKITYEEFMEFEKSITKDDKNKQESFCIQMSDFHFGAKTESFNRQIAIKRMSTVLEASRKILDAEQFTHNYNELCLLWVGDMLEGSGIYPTQAHHTELDAILDQINYFIDEIFIGLIEPWFKANFTRCKLRLIAVPGNHGRTGKYKSEKDNIEAMMFKTLDRHYKKYTTISIEANHEFIRPTKIQENNHLLYHGQAIRSYLGIPYYGLTSKGKDWGDEYEMHNYTLHIGHFHQMCYIPVGKNKMCLMTGTAKTDDEYSKERYGKDGIPKWCQWSEHPTHGTIGINWIDLTQGETT